MTNAHVVQGAISIEAHINKKSYSAKVVAMDVENDLAVIRIRAKDLQYLTIHDSDRVRLAEEVRAFGFPLVDRLGETIKITRGTVSGVTDRAGSKMFQLDVTVNAGNSGGPIVNEKGQVVGVVAAQMTGEGIADMSFAVPSNDVRELMDRHNLNYEVASDAVAPMTGPDLAEKVRQSVALLKVRVGPGGIGIAEKRVVQYRASWYASKKSGAGRIVPIDAGNESGVVLMSPSGEIAYCDAKKMLPAHLGPIATLGIQPLSGDNATVWHSRRLTVVPEEYSIQISTQSAGGHMLGRYYRPYGLRTIHPPRATTISTVKLHPAIELIKCELLKTSGDVVNVKKEHELVAMGSGGCPLLRISGNGSFEFDKRNGRPNSLEIDGSLAGTMEQVSFIPFMLKFNLADAEKLNQRHADAQERAKAAIAKSLRLAAEREAQKNANRVTADSIPFTRGLPRSR